MPSQRQELGCIIYTHERIDDAKINMEIIRSVWQQSGFFSRIHIVHAYNGKQTWYPKKYQEEVLVRRPNPGHYQGAAELIDAGVAAFQKQFPNVQYAVVLAADTWCVKPEYIAKSIAMMQRQKQYLASCPWGLPTKEKGVHFGLATDFFIVDLYWAKKYQLFPLHYQAFWKKYHEIISYLQPGGNILPEKVLLARFHDASFLQHHNNVRRKEIAASALLTMRDRIPVHRGKTAKGYWIRTFYWSRLGLITHHMPEEKQRILRRIKRAKGENISMLLKAKNLSYFNHSRVIRTSYD